MPFTGQDEFKQWMGVLEDSLYISRKRINNKLAIFNLQMSLLTSLLTTDGAYRFYSDLLNTKESQHEYISSNMKQRQHLIRFWTIMAFGYKRLNAAFKDVGDGILWRCLDYNRPVIYEMSNNSESSGMEMSHGRINELHALMDIYYDDDVASFVLTAVTDTCRVSDIVVRRKDSSIDLFEVKSSKSMRGEKWRSRVSRQEDRMKKIVTLANGDVYNDDDGSQIKIVYYDKAPRLAVSNIISVVSQSNNDVHKVINDQLYVYGIINSSDNIDESKIVEDYRREYGIPVTDQLIVTTSAAIYNKSPNRTPFSIYPIDPRLYSEIMMCERVIVYIYNLTKLLADIETREWAPTLVRKENSIEIVIRKDRLSCVIPGYALYRCVFEGQDVEELLHPYEAVYSAKDEYTGNLLIGYRGERSVWL